MQKLVWDALNGVVWAEKHLGAARPRTEIAIILADPDTPPLELLDALLAEVASYRDLLSASLTQLRLPKTPPNSL